MRYGGNENSESIPLDNDDPASQKKFPDLWFNHQEM